MVLFMTVDMYSYWVFAFKYWTASFDIKSEQVKRRKAELKGMSSTSPGTVVGTN